MTRCTVSRAKYRTKNLMVVLSDEVNQVIIHAVAESMLSTINIKTGEKQPPIADLRAILEPAYVELAIILNAELGDRHYASTDLDKLHAEFNLSFGNYRLRLDWQDEKSMQSFVVDVKTEDQKSVVTRFIEEHGSSAKIPAL